MKKQKRKYRYSLKKYSNTQFLKIEKEIKKRTMRFLKNEYARQKDLGVHGAELTKKMRLAKRSYIYTSLVEYHDTIEMLEGLRKINIKDYSRSQLQWYSSMFTVEMSLKGAGFNRDTNFMFRFMKSLKERGFDIYDVSEMQKLLGGMSQQQIIGFADWAKEKLGVARFFYDIMDNDEKYTNDKIFELLMQYALSENIKNDIIEKNKMFLGL